MTFQYNIKSIPTAYAGVNFRSRLEAKWAAFFDLCGWEWEYEPFDLDGWAPDFLLKGRVQALVEVKPVTFVEGTNMDKYHERLIGQAKLAAKKAFNVGVCSREVLVVGLGPFRCHVTRYGEHEWGLGVFASQNWGGSPDIATLWAGNSRALDYASSENSYQYRIGGQSDGDHHLKRINDNAPEVLWRAAGNAVQWQVAEDGLPDVPAHSSIDVSRIIRKATS